MLGDRAQQATALGRLSGAKEQHSHDPGSPRDAASGQVAMIFIAVQEWAFPRAGAEDLLQHHARINCICGLICKVPRLHLVVVEETFPLPLFSPSLYIVGKGIYATAWLSSSDHSKNHSSPTKTIFRETDLKRILFLNPSVNGPVQAYLS